MARYINIEKFENISPYCPNCGNNCERECEFFRSIFAENIAEDVEPVVHAKWKTITEPFHDVGDDYVTRECSICGCELTTHIDYKTPYCPHCGAKMDKE